MLGLWGYIAVVIARPAKEVSRKKKVQGLNEALKLEPAKCKDLAILFMHVLPFEVHMSLFHISVKEIVEFEG